MQIAMLGTRGVPAAYGGFETAVEEIGARLAARGHEVTVYTRERSQVPSNYRGMRLISLPSVRSRSFETLSHTTLSVLHLTRNKTDVAVLFNAGNAPLLPALKAARIPTAVHMDGLEWKRAKWQGLGARYYRYAERMAALRADVLIADAAGIAQYLREVHERESVMIPYGAPIIPVESHRLGELGLEKRKYHLVVARLEPENNVDLIVNGYLESDSPVPLVVVGSVPYSNEHSQKVLRLAQQGNVRMLGGIWDQELLDQLYSGARSYLHGHSVGGTNPSLLRAMGASAPVSAFDVTFNREVTKGHARLFRSAEDVTSAINEDDLDPEAARSRGHEGMLHVKSSYNWDEVADAYESMLRDLAGRLLGNIY